MDQTNTNGQTAATEPAELTLTSEERGQDELTVLRRLSKTLEAMDEGARRRTLAYLSSRYG